MDFQGLYRESFRVWFRIFRVYISVSFSFTLFLTHVVTPRKMTVHDPFD